MTLERWIALVLLGVSAIYGYTAWFAMDGLLPPIMRNNPVWPSSFPKILSIAASLLCLGVLINLERTVQQVDESNINYKEIFKYKTGQASMLIMFMLGYTFLLRPLGFVPATALFLYLSSHVLGERRIWLMLLVSIPTSIGIWYLVNEVLGIYLTPLPQILLNLAS